MVRPDAAAGGGHVDDRAVLLRQQNFHVLEVPLHLAAVFLVLPAAGGVAPPDLAVHGVVHIDGDGGDGDGIHGEGHAVLGEGLAAAEGDGGILVIHIKAELPMALHCGDAFTRRVIPDAQVLELRRGGTTGDRHIGGNGLHHLNGAAVVLIRYEPGAAVAAAPDGQVGKAEAAYQQGAGVGALRQ